ncbi:MAG: DUF177 domain-containing protein [Chloroflexi bacterium]|nr:MAG: DUF177 domain-containing protein [Chloroflexota bacterium]
MGINHLSRLRFNFGFLLEAAMGTSREIELAYPTIQIEEVTLTPLRGKFQATRTSEGIYLTGTLYSTIPTECVRCLETMNLNITIQLDELFYHPPFGAPEGASVIGDSGIIDLEPLVRELALLEVPMQPICRPDCQGLCMECGHNLNLGDCGCEEDDIDPRLSILQQLLKGEE